jgi:hypothetical protein
VQHAPHVGQCVSTGEPHHSSGSVNGAASARAAPREEAPKKRMQLSTYTGKNGDEIVMSVMHSTAVGKGPRAGSVQVT